MFCGTGSTRNQLTREPPNCWRMCPRRVLTSVVTFLCSLVRCSAPTSRKRYLRMPLSKLPVTALNAMLDSRVDVRQNVEQLRGRVVAVAVGVVGLQLDTGLPHSNQTFGALGPLKPHAPARTPNKSGPP